MFFSRKVRVTFIDAASDTVIGVTKLPPDQLPESFLLETQMQIRGEDWSVVKAEPLTRQEYAKTGELTLILAKASVSYVDPKELLFTLPTISDELPTDEGRADGTEVVLLEDDWRQFEFVSTAYLGAIADELQAIQRIYNEHRQGIAFDKLHMRSRIDSPLSGLTVTAKSLPFTSSEPLRFKGHDQRIQGGFAYRLNDGWLLYGSELNSVLRTLAVREDEPDLFPSFVEALEVFASSQNLLVVDWCRCRVGQPGTASFSLAFSDPLDLENPKQ